MLDHFFGDQAVVDSDLSVTGGDLLTFDFTDLSEFQSIVDSGADFLTIRLETNNFATIGFASLEDPTLLPQRCGSNPFQNLHVRDWCYSWAVFLFGADVSLKLW